VQRSLPEEAGKVVVVVVVVVVVGVAMTIVVGGAQQLSQRVWPTQTASEAEIASICDGSHPIFTVGLPL
jgi:TRAP-type C4-dicarboxylate transport system permease small subunit